MRERDILHALERDQVGLPPLTFARSHVPVPNNVDAVYDISWDGTQGYRFVVNVKARATSQALAAAAQQAKSHAFDAKGTFPLIVVPYLSPASLDEVERLGISAVDLCGNGIVQVQRAWLVRRSGRPNRFRSVDRPRGAYRGVASLVARAFMVQPDFSRVGDIKKFIEHRGARITLSTVSKAVTRLEEDLVIARERDGLRLLQRDKLLTRLREAYQPPTIRNRLSVKSGLAERQLHERLRDAAQSLGSRLVLSGIASANDRTLLAAEPISTFYCEALPEDLAAAASIDPTPQRRFVDLELLQTDDERVYFDAHEQDRRALSSPVQTWLELATGDKRSQEVAETLRVELIGTGKRR